eukprot:scaffold3411_cov396-Prasinococcus_capsulatus_cf.AAC.8
MPTPSRGGCGQTPGRCPSCEDFPLSIAVRRPSGPARGSVYVSRMGGAGEIVWRGHPRESAWRCGGI